MHDLPVFDHLTPTIASQTSFPVYRYFGSATNVMRFILRIRARPCATEAYCPPSSDDDEVDPCYRPAYRRGRGGTSTKLVRGTGDFDQCKLCFNVLFSPSMPDQPPSIPGQSLPAGETGTMFVQPHLVGKFIATENFWYTRRSPDIKLTRISFPG